MKIKQKNKKIRYNTPLLFIVLLSVLVHGGYYNFFVFFSGAILTLLIALQVYKDKKIRIPLNLSAWCLYGLCLCQLLAIPFAVNSGMAFAGFLRIAVWMLFFVYVQSYTKDERMLILDTVAYEGTVLAGISVLAFVYDKIIGIEDLNGRIDGLFEYANTWALFQLLCMVFLLLRERPKKTDYLATGVLLCGILLSGSRGVILLLLFVAAFGVIRYAAVQKSIVPFLSGLLVTVVVVLLSSWVSGGMVFERIKGISLASSSLNGRFLYWKDGVRILLNNPMGLGRGGYWYIQTAKQTGIYTLRFVHNEYLQMALDGGILSGVLLVVLIISLLWEKNKTIREYVGILLIGIHCIIDFDLQFSAIVFILLLCGTNEKYKEISVARFRIVQQIAVGCLVFVFGYFSLAYYMHFGGNYRLSYIMFPADLEISEDYMCSFAMPEQAEEVADRIIESTDLSMLAWDCKFAAAEQRQDMAQMLYAKYHYLKLNTYRGTVYEEFITLLENAYEQGNLADQEVYREYAENTMVMLHDVMRKTDPLAYRIIDKPEFGFSNTVLERLSEIARKEVEVN